MLLEWYKEEYMEKKLSVSRAKILLQARRIYAQFQADGKAKPGLKLSSGWLEQFLHRNKLVQRRHTTVGQKTPKDCFSRVLDFVVFLKNDREKHKYKEDNILACDETGVWLDSTSPTSIAPKGSKEVAVKHAGYDELRLTVILTAKADGSKLKSYVILNRKKPVPEVIKKFEKKLVLAWAGKSWMGDTLTEDYLRRVIGPLLLPETRILVWDSFRCHTSEETKKVMSSLRLNQAVVPGGTTKFVQPADVSWNKPFKQHIQR